MTEYARGVITVEANATGFEAGIAKAVRSAEKFEKAAVDSGKKAGAAMVGAARDTEVAAGQVDAVTRRFLQSLKRQSEAAGLSRTEHMALRAAQMGVSDQAAPMIARLRAAEKAITSTGVSAGQTAAAMRMVPAQMTDIVTSLAGGMPVWQVAIQQGGQLKDSFGGIGPMFRNMASLITPARIAMGGLVGGVGALVTAYVQGAKESDAFTHALVMSGNAVGLTNGQLVEMAKNVDLVVGTQAGASEALAAFAGTGQVAAGNLEKFSATAVRMEQVVGRSVQDTVKDFAELGKAPVEASLKLTEQYRYLTLATYNQIKALMDQGRAAEAAAVAQNAYADAMNSRTGQIEANLGSIERAWISLKGVAASTWDAMLGIGRRVEPKQALSAAEANVAALQDRIDSGRGGVLTGPRLEAAKAERDRLRAEVTEQERSARAQKDSNDLQAAGIKAQAEFDKRAEASLSKRAQLTKELAKQDKINADLRAAGMKVDEAADARIRAQLRERYSEEGAGGGAKAYRDDAATRMLQQLRETEASLNAQLEGEEKLGAAAKARVEFEAQIAILKAKGTLQADQQSLVANEKAIRAQLERNEAVEREIGLRELINKQLDAEAAAQERFAAAAEQLQEQLAGSRAGRREQYERSLGAFGLGDAARQQVEAQTSIYREHQRAQARLSKEASQNGSLGSAKYTEEVAKIKAELAASLADHDAYYAALRAAQADANVGASQALNNYLESARDVAGQTQDLMTNAFRGMEDALTSFVTTGKADFQSLADSIVADITRMIIKAKMAEFLGGGQGGQGGQGVGFVGQLLGQLVSGGARVGGPAPISASVASTVLPRAAGGPVAFGSPYLIGERGPELFVPHSSGNVVPLDRGARGGAAPALGGATTINMPVTIVAQDVESFRRSQGQVAVTLGSALSRGGRFR